MALNFSGLMELTNNKQDTDEMLVEMGIDPVEFYKWTEYVVRSMPEVATQYNINSPEYIPQLLQALLAVGFETGYRAAMENK